MKKKLNILSAIWISSAILSILLPNPFTFPTAVIAIFFLVVTLIFIVNEFVIKPRKKNIVR
ncbi:hypothetical protein [Isobaculum melis]|uniref:Uncharacterized protein n=1 Tax=Isobaculum melis TaxID=142588 RepID=A0A1H9U0D6_9LACT|nr:hypothetical protein [Isobaculum melis]SES02906.1 hypothetical protein SAMN04488559_11924 [Isobaculum melis]